MKCLFQSLILLIDFTFWGTISHNINIIDGPHFFLFLYLHHWPLSESLQEWRCRFACLHLKHHAARLWLEISFWDLPFTKAPSAWRTLSRAWPWRDETTRGRRRAACPPPPKTPSRALPARLFIVKKGVFQNLNTGRWFSLGFSPLSLLLFLSPLFLAFKW